METGKESCCNSEIRARLRRDIMESQITSTVRDAEPDYEVGPGSVMLMHGTVVWDNPQNKECDYCERANPTSTPQCAGCGAPLH
jgi:hypothetical protein